MIFLDIDPNVVKPGWTPLIIILVLGAVMVLLYRSMRRQFGKIQMPPTGSGSVADPAADLGADPDPGPNTDETGSSHILKKDRQARDV